MDNQYGPAAALPSSPPRSGRPPGLAAVGTACLQMTPGWLDHGVRPSVRPPAQVRLLPLLLAISDAGSARVRYSDASKLE